MDFLMSFSLSLGLLKALPSDDLTLNYFVFEGQHLLNVTSSSCLLVKLCFDDAFAASSTSRVMVNIEQVTSAY